MLREDLTGMQFGKLTVLGNPIKKKLNIIGSEVRMWNNKTC